MSTVKSLCTGKSLFLLAALVLLPQLMFAQWKVNIGAQSDDLGKQALAFLPNEIWINAGNSITFSLVTDEPHTVSFLIANQVRNPFDVGCPGYSADNSAFDGTTCISSPPLLGGQTFTVAFPATGNFKISCLFHENMSGVVHVLDASASLPHDQAFYDDQAKRQAAQLIGGGTPHHMHDDATPGQPSRAVQVGGGRVVSTGGGSSTLSVMRFMQMKLTVHVGETVIWTNDDPITPHTITFGDIPQDVIDPSSNVTVDADGSRHAVLKTTSDMVHSGFVQAAPQDRIGLPQSPVGTTRFKVTFQKPGTYHYICALHDGLGMNGTVTVLP